MMSLDNSLNNDLKESHKHHCICTAHLPTDDQRKHSMSTLQRIAEGIKKWEHPIGVPNSKRIIQDVNLAFKAYEIIYQNSGRIVPGLANRTGHRYSRDVTPRTKNYDALDEVWLEPDARNAWKERKSFTKSKYLGPF